MKWKLLPLLIFSCGVFGQSVELSKQLSLIKDLLPQSTRMGILYDPSNTELPNQIDLAAQENGLMAIKASVQNIREVSEALRAIKKYEVDFILIIDGTNVGTRSFIRFVVRQSARSDTPVFSNSDKAPKAGAVGWITKNNNIWQIRLNGAVLGRYNLTVPENHARFPIEG